MRVHGLEFAHDGFEGADAGDHQAVGVQHVLRLGAEDDLGAGAFQGADGRADVAGTVVQDRDGGFALGRGRLRPAAGSMMAPVAEYLAGHSAPLVDGMPSTRGSRLDGRAQGAGEGLELGLDDVVRVAAGDDVHVQADAGVQRDGLEDVAGQRAGEVAADQVVFLAGGLAAVHQVGAAGDVDDGVREGFVQGHGGLAEAADAGLVAQGRAQHLAEGDGDVLDGVVDVDVGVAGGLDGHVDQRVLAQRRQHVVVERDRGADVRHAGAVEVDLDQHGGFAGGRSMRAVRASAAVDPVLLMVMMSFDEGWWAVLQCLVHTPSLGRKLRLPGQDAFQCCPGRLWFPSQFRR